MSDHQRFLLGQQLDHLHHLDGEIERLDKEIERRLEPAKEVLERLTTIPGVGKRTAQVIVIEVGTDVHPFPTVARFVAWGGLAPGQNESAGKRKPAHVRPGNPTLRTAMVEVAQAAARSHNTYLSARYQHLAVRLKGKKAIVALARHILEIIYHILRDGDEYDDHGSDFYLRRNRVSIERRAIRQLEGLGYKVTLEQPPAA
jgi:transposase